MHDRNPHHSDFVGFMFYREYNHANLSVIKSAEGDKVITCVEGEIQPSCYLDHGKLYEVNHLRNEVMRASAAEPSAPSLEPLRSSIQEEITKYVRSCLSEGHGVASASTEADGSLSLSISISGSKLNPRNFWCALPQRTPAALLPPVRSRLTASFRRNGRWISSWQLTGIDPGAGAGTLAGESRMLVHYYEDGNVQLAARRAYPARPLRWDGGPAGAGPALAAAVRAAEAELHAWAERAHGPGLSEGAFRALRRKIPRTQTKFQWDKVAVYAVARELAASK
jgi:capping protein (actin filament) muscle Z-line, alpha